MTEARQSDLSENSFTAGVVELIRAWARRHDAVHGLALVGSHARGEAEPNSDVDFMLLVGDPGAFKVDGAWLGAISWASLGSRIACVEDEEYGAVWSRRVWLHPRGEIEFTFARPSWAALEPIDPGTRHVIMHGCSILHDPTGALARLSLAARTAEDAEPYLDRRLS